MLSASDEGKEIERPLSGGVKVVYRPIDEHTQAGRILKDVSDIVVPVFYFGILLWKAKEGRQASALCAFALYQLSTGTLVFGTPWSARSAMAQQR